MSTLLRRPGHLLAWLALSVCLALPGAAAHAAPVIAAASSVRFALEDLLRNFRDETAIQVRVTYGSSGNLVRQIEQGAPFELFLSADEGFALDLAEKGFTRDQGVVYAEGRLVLFVPTGSPLEPDAELRDLRRVLAYGELQRFAIANPEHAPYGRAAEQALRASGLWTEIQAKLVLGESVAQTAQFTASGNTGGGLIAYSLAVAPQFRDRGTFALLPQELHEPLRQRMVLTVAASAEAERLYRYLQSEASRAVFERYGFTFPKVEAEVDADGQPASP